MPKSTRLYVPARLKKKEIKTNQFCYSGGTMYFEEESLCVIFNSASDFVKVKHKMYQIYNAGTRRKGDNNSGFYMAT